MPLTWSSDAIGEGGGVRSGGADGLRRSEESRTALICIFGSSEEFFVPTCSVALLDESGGVDGHIVLVDLVAKKRTSVGIGDNFEAGFFCVTFARMPISDSTAAVCHQRWPSSMTA